MTNTTNRKAAPRTGTASTPRSKAKRFGSFNQGRFNKSKLPMPVVILARIGIKPKAANSNGYWQIRCPLHKDGHEQNASLSIHQVDGNFRCFACGAHGGDVLAFWMQLTCKSFKQAAQELGAWEVQQ
jgi:hypothetical protein